MVRAQVLGLESGVKKGFSSKRAAGSKNIKRKPIQILAPEVIIVENLGFTEIYPLSLKVVIGVTAALERTT